MRSQIIMGVIDVGVSGAAKLAAEFYPASEAFIPIERDNAVEMLIVANEFSVIRANQPVDFSLGKTIP